MPDLWPFAHKLSRAIDARLRRNCSQEVVSRDIGLLPRKRSTMQLALPAILWMRLGVIASTLISAVPVFAYPVPIGCVARFLVSSIAVGIPLAELFELALILVPLFLEKPFAVLVPVAPRMRKNTLTVAA